jgi:hypothetical protein
MLTRTFRSTGAEFGNMDLINDIKISSCMTSEKTAQTRRKPGADDQTSLCIAGNGVDFQQGFDRFHVIGDRDHMCSTAQSGDRQFDVIVGCGEHDKITLPRNLDESIDTGFLTKGGDRKCASWCTQGCNDFVQPDGIHVDEV